jgi:23S rRNA pseudouridine1911/1915/1917 synthase
LAEKLLIVDARLPLPARKLQNLVQQVLKIGKPAAARVIHDGAVRVNGRTLRRPLAVLEIGDRVEVDVQPQPSPRAATPGRSRHAQLEIAFEDEHLVVVNKPPHLLTVPTPYKERNTLISLLDQLLQQRTPPAKAFCVHRLDRGVSGLLVFGKSLPIAEMLRDQFAARKPQRQYAALVAGLMQHPHGTFRSHLATDEQLNRHSTADRQRGELAITHYQVRAEFGDASLVEIQLETGRRNQIRVHFAEAGHPVLGDPRYGRGTLRDRWPHRRLALHAQSLGLTHPVTGEAMSFDSPLPQEMRLFAAPRPADDRRPRKEKRRRRR